MAYRDNQFREQSSKRQHNVLMSRDDIFARFQSPGVFYEFEPAVVLDVIHDNDNNAINGKKADPSEWPKKPSGAYHTTQDSDFSWVGRIKVRMCYSEQGVNSDLLNWAIPLFQNQTEQPLVNEIVFVVKIFGHYYYTQTLNLKNQPNHNADFRYEQHFGLTGAYNYKGNVPGGGSSTQSTVGDGKGSTKQGAMGEYFKANDDVRGLKHFEGDKIFESRFGSSIRMGGYGTHTVNRSNTDEPVTNPKVDMGKSDDGYGNPQILIRNRQRPLSKNGPDTTYYYKILEDINNDGTSVHITSGRTISKWQTVCGKSIFQSSEKKEEQPAFSPAGATSYVFPKGVFSQNYDDSKYLIGDQIVVNSDRLIFQSKKNETLMFSKRRFGIVTDDEYTVDAHQQVVITSNTKTVLNAPFIFLGEYNQSKEPVLLGQTTIDWLYAFCEFIKTHTHFYHHTHINAGQESPENTQFLKETEMLKQLEQSLPTLCSNRVFVVGGGYAPGQDGGSIPGGTTPGSISAIPGGYYVPKKGEFNGTISPGTTSGTATPLAQPTDNQTYGENQPADSSSSGGSTDGSSQPTSDSSASTPPATDATPASSTTPATTPATVPTTGNTDANGKFVPTYKMTANAESGDLATPSDPAAVGGIDPGTGDAGGKSYGTYQIASNNGEMDKFLADPNNPYASQLNAAGPVGSPAFDSEWKSLAATDNAGFGQAQQNFITQNDSSALTNFTQTSGIDVSQRSPQLQDLVYGTANQYGGTSQVATAVAQAQANSPTPLTDQQIAYTIQDTKLANVSTNFKSSSPSVQQGVTNRIISERSAFDTTQIANN